MQPRVTTCIFTTCQLLPYSQVATDSCMPLKCAVFCCVLAVAVFFTDSGWAINFETLSSSLARVIKVCKLKKAIVPGTAIYGNDETELKCTVISKAYPS